MKIGVIGSAMVGQAVARRLIETGHDVVVGTRDPSKLDDKKGMGATLREWQASIGGAGKIDTNAAAAAHGELIINATSGDGAINALTLAGAQHMAGKILIDISNPLDFSKGMPPTLFVKDTDSLAEQIQRAFPDTKVVKTLNTMTASVMLDPMSVGNGDHTVFVSGNDADAKAQVTELLKSFGWSDVLDLGDLTSARGTEMLLPLWLRSWMALGTGNFQFKVVR
jgi:8-hydroxy-5-deazaflavin:NADPH oxidoreductase